MQCRRGTYNVAIQHPNYHRNYAEYCKDFCNFLGILLFLSILIGLILYFVKTTCQAEPVVYLDSTAVRNLTLHRNSSIPPPDVPWHVDSSFGFDLDMWNVNYLPGCFCTFRRAVVQVRYRDQVVVEQEVEFHGFGLKPNTHRHAWVQVEGEGVRLEDLEGASMADEFRRGDMRLDVHFKFRYLRNDRKASWLHKDYFDVGPFGGS